MEHNQFKLLERLLSLLLDCATETYWFFLLEFFFACQRRKLVTSRKILDPLEVQLSPLKLIRPASLSSFIHLILDTAPL
jgi:hypothetical protein